MEFSHSSVLLSEVVENASSLPADGVAVDCTLGGAGHAHAVGSLLEESGCLVGIDRDEAALAKAREVLSDLNTRVELVHGSYSDFSRVVTNLGISEVDFILADLGVSSFQLDNSERGFSFQTTGPLDMRMNSSEGPTLSELIEGIERDELARVIREYGEERRAQAVAGSILRMRDEGTLNTTGDLAHAVRSVLGKPKGKRAKDPATKTFQGLRIWVNRELEELKVLLRDGPEMLSSGGVLAIISFHSLEDRLVKNRFRELSRPELSVPDGLPLQKSQLPPALFWASGAIKPSAEEIERNPRSRSAVLRILKRLPVTDDNQDDGALA